MFVCADLLSVLFSFHGGLLLIVLVLTLYMTCNFLCDVRVSDLEKKAVFITGCDSGFGHELAKKLDAQGLRVFAACLTSEGEAKLKNECSAQLRTVKLDVAKPSDVQKAFDTVKSNLPVTQGLWAVVNNAGVANPGMIEWQSLEEMKKIMDINLWGMVSVIKAFLPLLKRTKGRVVNVASCSGRVATPVLGAYCISKYGVEAFSDCLCNEIRHFGVSVHIIEPGGFKTNITNTENNIQHLDRLWKGLDADTQECYGIEYLEKVKCLTADIEWLRSSHIYKVVDAMAHAVTSTRPKLRYGVGWDHIFWQILSFLPSEIQDLVYFSFPKPKGISDHN